MCVSCSFYARLNGVWIFHELFGIRTVSHCTSYFSFNGALLCKLVVFLAKRNSYTQIIGGQKRRLLLEQCPIAQCLNGKRMFPHCLDCMHMDARSNLLVLPIVPGSGFASCRLLLAKGSGFLS